MKLSEVTPRKDDVSAFDGTVELRGRTRINWNNPNEVELYGIETHGVTLVTSSPTAIVIKQRGYSQNPGSRNSGLMAHYPTEVSTWLVGEPALHRETKQPLEKIAWCYPVISWDARPSKS